MCVTGASEVDAIYKKERNSCPEKHTVPLTADIFIEWIKRHVVCLIETWKNIEKNQNEYSLAQSLNTQSCIRYKNCVIFGGNAKFCHHLVDCYCNHVNTLTSPYIHAHSHHLHPPPSSNNNKHSLPAQIGFIHPLTPGGNYLQVIFFSWVLADLHEKYFPLKDILLMNQRENGWNYCY